MKARQRETQLADAGQDTKKYNNYQNNNNKL